MSWPPASRAWRLPRATAAVCCAITLAAVAAFTPATAPARTVTDTLGRTVDVPDNPQRVLLGFYFEDFRAIVGDGAFDRVVAISRDTWAGWRASQWDAYVAVAPNIDKLVDIGEVESGTFNIELAVASRPDLAIIAAWQFRSLGETVNKLEAAGIPVVVADFNAQTVDKHVASARLIGEVMGAGERGAQLADEYAAAVADVERRVASAARDGDAPKVYVELGSKGPQEIGNSYGDVMWGGVIKLAGGNNIASGKVERWGPLSPEYVLAQDPDIVVIPGSAWRNRPTAVLMGFGVDASTTRERLLPYLDRPGWSSMNAVVNGKVFALYHGGTRTLYDYTFLQYLAKQIHPAAFADVDPQGNHRRFYERYLPVQPDGTFMLSLQP